MAEIVTTGRTDLDNLFLKSDILSSKNLKHTPFIVFQEQDDSIVVVLAKNKDELLAFPDETKVMVQWEGQWRSDFFQLTVGDVREYLEEAMIKIVLHKKGDRYRAVIGSGSRVGWAYPLRQYQENGIDTLEAVVDEHGKSNDKGDPVYKFVRDEDKWIASGKINALHR